MLKIFERMYQASTTDAALYILFGSVWSFFLPIGDFILLIVFLLLCDFITGNLAAHKRGEAITSRGWRCTLVKTSAYAIAIISTEYVKLVFFHDFNINIAYSVSLVIVTIEVKSINENIFTITGVDVFKFLLSKLKNKQDGNL